MEDELDLDIARERALAARARRLEALEQSEMNNEQSPVLID